MCMLVEIRRTSTSNDVLSLNAKFIVDPNKYKAFSEGRTKIMSRGQCIVGAYCATRCMDRCLEDRCNFR